MTSVAETPALGNVLVFQPRGQTGFTITIAGRDFIELLDAAVLIECREHAAFQLEEITARLAEKFGTKDPVMMVSWLFTPDYRRPDNFQGIFEWLFLFAVSDRLVELGHARCATLHRDVPDWAAKRLSLAGFVLKRAPQTLRQRAGRWHLVRNAWQTILFLTQCTRHLVESRGEHRIPPGSHARDVLVKIPAEGTAVRYGDLVNVLGEQGWSIVGQNFDAEDRERRPLLEWRLFAWSSVSRILGALNDALVLKSRLARMKQSGPEAWINDSPVLAPSLYSTARRMLQIRLWNAALAAGLPCAALLVSSLTRPEDRLLIERLKRHGVPVAQVLPRPLNPDRPAEKLIESDRQHPETLPDLFIVRDEQSREALMDQGIDSGRIWVGATSSSEDLAGSSAEHLAVASDQDPNTRILLLFIAFPEANAALCRALADAVEHETKIEVLVRRHPTRELHSSEREQLDRLSAGWREESSVSIGDQVSSGTLALTSVSTSAIEAARAGAAVLWAPFTSEVALFQRRFMEKLGRIAENQTELIDQVQTLVADHEIGRAHV